MPQVVAAVLIGAGIAAGMKWLAKEFARAADAARQAHDQMQDQMARHTPIKAVPKDLGSLEWDAETGVYRPSKRRT